MAYSIFWCDDKFDEKELEQYKEKDALEEVLRDLAKEHPALAKVMVDERDEYLTHSIYQACLETKEGADIVGVVGIGHSAGIEKNWPEAAVISMMSGELLK